MSWTYSGNPASSSLDAVRFLTGDTVQTESWTLSNEEITYLIGLSPTNVYLAAARAAEAVVSKFGSMQQSKTIGDLSISWSNRFTQFQEVARSLKARATLTSVAVYVTGMSQAEKADANADTDRIAPAGRIDGMSQDISSNPLTAQD
jgi:hypothetical protein